MARPQVLQCGRFRFAARRRVGSGDKASTSAKGPGVAASPTLEPTCDRNSLDANDEAVPEEKEGHPRGCPRPYRPQPSSPESSAAHPGPPSCRTFGVGAQLTSGPRE